MKIIKRSDAKMKGLKVYFTGIPCKHGHLVQRVVSNGNCKTCMSKRGKKYIAANKDAKRKKNYDYYHANKEKSLEISREYYKKNKEEIIKRQVSYRIDNYETRKLDTTLKLKSACYSMLSRVLKSTNINKSSRTKELLGYSTKELKKHLESQFTDGMNWNNHGEWHIDHKTPLSLMISQGITDPSIINALDNLQPMWAKENLSKGNRYCS